MPRLPNELDLGDIPSGRSGRPIATYKVDDMIREGYAALGAGIAKFGAGLASAAGNASAGKNKAAADTANLAFKQFQWNETKAYDAAVKNLKPEEAFGFQQRWSAGYKQRADAFARQHLYSLDDETHAAFDRKLVDFHQQGEGWAQKDEGVIYGYYQDKQLEGFMNGTIRERLSAAAALPSTDPRRSSYLADARRDLYGAIDARTDKSELEKAQLKEKAGKFVDQSFLTDLPPGERAVIADPRITPQDRGDNVEVDVDNVSREAPPPGSRVVSLGGGESAVIPPTWGTEDGRKQALKALNDQQFYEMLDSNREFAYSMVPPAYRGYIDAGLDAIKAAPESVGAKAMIGTFRQQIAKVDMAKIDNKSMAQFVRIYETASGTKFDRYADKPPLSKVDAKAGVAGKVGQYQYLAETATPGGTMGRQGVQKAIGNLHPTFASNLERAIKQARAEGIPASIFSAYRPPGYGVGGYTDKTMSLHAYGLAVDVTGIGKAGSATAQRWYEIATANGLFNPYGPNNRSEWNHYQGVAEKGEVFTRTHPDLKKSITSMGPDDPQAMWAAAGLGTVSDQVDGRLSYRDFPNMTYDEMVKISDSARKEVQVAENKMENVSGDEVTKLLTDKLINGTLTREDVETNRDVLSVNRYSKLVTALERGETKKSSRAEYRRLMDLAELDPEDALSDAREAFLDGTITKSDYKDVEREADPQEKSKRSKEINPNVVGARKALQGRFRPATNAHESEFVHYEEIISRFDQWVANHPKATYKDVTAYSENLFAEEDINRRVLGARNKPMSRFFPPTATPMTLGEEDITAAMTGLLAYVKRLTERQGRVKAEAIQQDIALINEWRDIIAGSPVRSRFEKGQ